VLTERDAEVWEKYSAELTRFATTLVGPGRAEDVVADGVLSAMTAPSWPSVAEPRAYLFRAVHNQAKMLHRSEGRRLTRELASAHLAPSARAEHWIEVRDAVSRLTLRERAVLYLAYWLDLPVDEIATTLGLSRRTTMRALASARSTLQKGLS
jgi:RNA polymerase sigma factor (sigma-70 family)